MCESCNFSTLLCNTLFANVHNFVFQIYYKQQLTLINSIMNGNEELIIVMNSLLVVELRIESQYQS